MNLWCENLKHYLIIIVQNVEAFMKEKLRKIEMKQKLLDEAYLENRLSARE